MRDHYRRVCWGVQGGGGSLSESAIVLGRVRGVIICGGRISFKFKQPLFPSKSFKRDATVIRDANENARSEMASCPSPNSDSKYSTTQTSLDNGL